ncbi:MAG: beta-galactosidase trimerization domain-containing protein [Kiritimatiellae bacterium]|nr:beta-galactosidase trimerization domain-containing protein [Kiritimatiellia bacterium]
MNGRSRYLLGTIIYHHPSAKDYRHTEGYDAADAWIYETPPDRAYLDRLGFDSVGGEVSLTWLGAFRPEAKVWQGRKALDWDIAAKWWLSGLPTIVDFTCARWSHGCMQYEEGREPSREAIPEGGAGHFMPYSLVTPEGRALYAKMWRSGAEELKAHGATPYAYELFNEPTYEEVSPASRAAFARHLGEVFAGDAAAMDAAWGSRYGSFEAAADFRHPNECPGLGVEWIKFRERVFASGIHLGAETIRQVVPGARVCFQPSNASFGGVNVLRANRECGVVMAPTGGGTAFDACLLRAIADGKPIIDGETYLGHTRESHRAKPLLHYSRGLNASYYFKWDRRLDDPRFSGADGPERMAETFPYVALNPAATKASAFAGLLDARREISFVEDVMNPRERGIPRGERAAFLFSMPTERLGAAAGHGNHNFTRASAEALMAAHLPMAAVFEEQIPEGRLEGYRFLVASGIDATYAGTVPALLEWTARGGELVVGPETMELDEWSNRRDPAATLGIALGEKLAGEPARFVLDGVEYEGAPYRAVAAMDGWTVAAALPDGTPAVLERAIGSGRARYVAVRLSRAEEARLLANLAAGAGILPSCSATDFETGEEIGDLEVHAGRGENGDTAFILTLHGLSPRAVRFVPGPGFAAASLANAATREVLGRDADGAALLLMEPESPVVLRGSPLPAAEAETYESVSVRAAEWLAARRPKTAASAFKTDPARMRFLDLRAVANRSFVDSVAGDGKGGWTDQGENCLRNAPWGVTDCNGVPFDFIRPDQNDDRACVMLRSEKLPYLPEAVRGIDAGLKAEALFFLHAGAWLEGVETEIMRYVVHYADGTDETVPVVARRDIDDWWIDGRKRAAATARCRIGWRNSENRGFCVLRWDNPHPEKTIATIDVESACGVAIPIVAAISAQVPDPSPLAVWRLKASPWGGAKTLLRGGGLEITADDATKDWAGARLALPEPVMVEDPSAAGLAFDFNGGMTALGAFDVPPPAFQVRVAWRGADGVERRSKYLGPEIAGGATDGDPDNWQTASLPMRRLVDADGPVELTAVYVQFRLMPARRAGIVVRDIRVGNVAE